MTAILVLDNCGFRGTPQAQLSRFAEDHCVVLPYVLPVECLATQSSNAVRLLHMFQDLIRAGAYCGHSPLDLCEEEKQNLSPARTILDLRATAQVRDCTLADASDFVKAEARRYRKSVVPIVERLLALATQFYNNGKQRNLLRKMHQEEKRPVRLKQCVEHLDTLGNKVMETAEPDLASRLNSGWYSWHDRRLRVVLAYEWACMKAQSGCMPALEKALHDFHDMRYVACLSKADGLLTRDKDLVEPLARAAFPSKDVFLDIGHATDEYRFAASA